MKMQAFVAAPRAESLSAEGQRSLEQAFGDRVTLVTKPEFQSNLLELARFACLQCPNQWVALVAANAILPLELTSRLLTSASEDAVVIAPLSNASAQTAPFSSDARTIAFDAISIDRQVWHYGQRRLIPQPELNGPLIALHTGRAKGIETASDWAGFCQMLVDSAQPPLLSDSIYCAYAQAPGWRVPVEDRGDPAPAHPLAGLRAHIDAAAEKQVDSLADAELPGVGEKAVLLHITHSWGGGVHRWLEDFCNTDSTHHHLWLMSAGQSSGTVHGQRLVLRSSHAANTDLATWPLELSIASSALHHEQYQQVLDELRRRFAIDGVVVSSLVGHSLDVLRTGLPTMVVCHDYFPISPDLELRFEQDQGRDALRGNAALFGDAHRREWNVLSRQYRELTHQDNVTLVAPDESVRNNRVKLDAELASQSVNIIPHGMRPWPKDVQWTYQSPQPGQKLRLLVPGQMSTAKGRTLLLEALPELTEVADIYLLGVGKRQGESFYGVNGVHVVHAYQRDQLPALIQSIAPHAGLLLSLVSESFSYTLSELWSIGLPPIAIRSGALALRIEHGRTGLLLEPTTKALVEQIKRLHDDPRPLQQMAKVIAQLPTRQLGDMVAAYLPLLPEHHASCIESRHASASDALRIELEHRLSLTRRTLADSQSALDQLNTELEKRRQWVGRLEKQLAERTRWAESNNQQVEAARSKLTALQAELKERAEWGQQLEADLDTARSRLDAAEAQAKRHAQWGQALDQELEQARLRLSELDAQLEQRAEWAQGLNEQLENATRHIERTEAERDQARQDFQASQTALTKAIEQAEQIQETLQAKLQLSWETVDRTEQERDAARARIDELDQLLDERTQWARSLDTENQAMQQRIQDLTNEIEQLGDAQKQLLASRSWRLTRPLRGIARLLQRIKASLAFRSRRFLSTQRRVARSVKIRGIGGTVRRIRQEFRHDHVPTVEIGQLPTDLLPFTLDVDENPLVSVVIPVYNQIQHTYHCLASIARHGSQLPMEVIVVNDCSSDETSEVLTRIKGLKVLNNEQNMGFVDACNRGVDMAMGDWVVLLNNDTAVSENWLDALYETFLHRSDAGLVGSQLVYPDGRLQESGGIIFSDGSGWNYGRLQDAADPRYNYLRETDYCSGAAIMFRRNLFRELGGFDTRYRPAYYEDTDLAFKMREAGYKVYVQPASRVTHYEGITSGTDLTQGVKQYQVVNQQKFLQRWSEALAQQPEPTDQVDKIKEFRVSKRALIVDACTPEPDKDSGSVRMMNLFEILQQMGYKTTFMADNLAYVERYTQDLQKRGVEVLYHPWTTASAVFTERGEEFDVIFLSRHYIASKYVDLARTHAPQAQLLFDTVDLHYLREQRHAELEQSKALARTAQTTRKLELGVARACDVTLVVSPYEKEVLAEELPNTKVAVLSNIHRVMGRRTAFKDRKDIMFVGGYQHPPNIDAAKWFCQDIFPRVRARLPDVRFHLIGSKATAEVEALGDIEGVEFHGFVPAIEPWLEQCRLAVAPLRYGAGVKGKVNSSMSHGQPVVATSPAVEGMHVVVGEDVLVADDADQFADEVIRLYNDPDLWQTLSDNGLDNVRRHFSFESAYGALETILSRPGA